MMGGGKGKFLSLTWVQTIPALCEDIEIPNFISLVLKFEENID